MEEILPPEKEELLLTILFSASIPDLQLSIPEPTTVSSAGLKQLIRSKLPEHLSNRRLRLIHAGKALEDSSPLSTALKLDRRPSPSRDVDGRARSSLTPPRLPRLISHDKGKARIGDPPLPRVYIHCSVGDIVLSPAELKVEVREATIQNAQRDVSGGDAGDAPSVIPVGTSSSGQRTTAPPPCGFDRLLSAGFTVAEVSTLRSQFLALQSLTHTPDTMPSGEELRRLEDQWMDEGSDGVGGDSGIINDGGGFASDGAGPLDDMLWGSVMGFFWPIGCALWLLREDGVWSWRKGLAVFVGVVVNLGFGVVRVFG